VTISTEKPSRRAALGALASVPVLALPVVAAGAGSAVRSAIPAMAHSAISASDDLTLDLWTQRHAFRQPKIDADIAYEEAAARMPDWARGGLQMLGYGGVLSGQDVGWPAIQGSACDYQIATLQKHPVPAQVSKDLAACLSLRKKLAHNFTGQLANSEETGREALALYRKELRELATRRRAQRFEEERAGVTAAEARIEALVEACRDIEDQIADLPPLTPNAVAARMLIPIEVEAGKPFAEGCENAADVKALAQLRPHLTGLLRAHVDEIFDNPSMPAGLLQVVQGFTPGTVARLVKMEKAAA